MNAIAMIARCMVHQQDQTLVPGTLIYGTTPDLPTGEECLTPTDRGRPDADRRWHGDADGLVQHSISNTEAWG